MGLALPWLYPSESQPEMQGIRDKAAAPSDVGGGAVDGLEDGGVTTDVARGREAETTDQTGACFW